MPWPWETQQVETKTSDNTVTPDPAYDFVPPRRKDARNAWPVKKGTQCGECGIKFDYGCAYGFNCSNPNCPTGWNRR